MKGKFEIRQHDQSKLLYKKTKQKNTSPDQHSQQAQKKLQNFWLETSGIKIKNQSGNMNRRHIYYHAPVTPSHMFPSCILLHSTIKINVFQYENKVYNHPPPKKKSHLNICPTCAKESKSSIASVAFIYRTASTVFRLLPQHYLVCW